MFASITSDWKIILDSEFEQSYFKDLELALKEEYTNFECYPPRDLIFNAFKYCSFEDLKVVIIGQDPYHGTGEANGLCFSVNEGVKIPPSLRNIFSEISTDLNTVFLPSSGNLEYWAKQGVLLLNSSLTVKKDIANSHKHLNWPKFTDAVIQEISSKKKHVVFLLWGAFAQKKAKLIDTNKHFVLESGHPSFAHSHKKWFGNHHFSKTNAYLEKINEKPIQWF